MFFFANKFIQNGTEKTIQTADLEMSTKGLLASLTVALEKLGSRTSIISYWNFDRISVICLL